MKISSTHFRQPTDPIEPRSSSAGIAATATSTVSSNSTQVALSATSSALHSDTADVNLARVNALREAIRRGELAVDAGKIADGLIESTRELLRHTP